MSGLAARPLGFRVRLRSARGLLARAELVEARPLLVIE